MPVRCYLFTGVRAARLPVACGFAALQRCFAASGGAAARYAGFGVLPLLFCIAFGAAYQRRAYVREHGSGVTFAAAFLPAAFWQGATCTKEGYTAWQWYGRSVSTAVSCVLAGSGGLTLRKVLLYSKCQFS
ncbi:hypothetical protein NPIL_182091 [Nephila pilipes]|uniref:Transmembrane protein n=1 Tax=Nephila pilipes TaxID=299642 RepID=A0A8X6PJD7_NEPPI|nr:hypothetical protein NPIL_182091 [Nephila pilipes]